MHRQVIFVRQAVIAAVAAAMLTIPIASVAQAQQGSVAQAPQGVRTADRTAKPCKYWDAAPSKRCLDFRSDSTFPQGLSDYHGTGGR